jgi:hypothetical protein
MVEYFLVCFDDVIPGRRVRSHQDKQASLIVRMGMGVHCIPKYTLRQVLPK